MCPCEELCKLPDLSFIGGASKTFKVNVFTKSGNPATLDGITAKLSIVNASLRGSAPIIQQQMEKSPSLPNVFMTTLSPDQTINLYGKFIYQIDVVSNGVHEEPKQGNLYIGANIYRSSISNR